MIDIFLGDLNGLEVVRRIRQSSDLSGLFIIMVSGIDKTGECLAAGANDFLLKPYMPEELFEIDQDKIVCLNIDAAVLQKVRKVREKQFGLKPSYSEFKTVFGEVEYVLDLVRKHRTWKVVDTTNKSIEETAWEIIHAVYGDEHDEYT